jgi:hypothetical protein
MMRILTLGGSALLWGLMMILLVRREVVPYFEYQAPPTYRSYLKGVQGPLLSTADILAAGTKVGSVETLMYGDGNWTILTRLQMKARASGLHKGSGDEIQVGIKSRSYVDAFYRLYLATYDIRLSIAQITLRASREKDVLVATYEFLVGGRRVAGGTQKIEFPPDGMIGDLFQPFPGGGPLHVGKKWKIPTLSPDLTGFRVSSLYAAVTEHQRVEWNGQMIDALRVEIRTEPTEEKRPKYVVLCREDGLALIQQFTYENLLYEIVVRTRRTLVGTEQGRWIAEFDREP